MYLKKLLWLCLMNWWFRIVSRAMVGYGIQRFYYQWINFHAQGINIQETKINCTNGTVLVIIIVWIIIYIKLSYMCKITQIKTIWWLCQSMPFCYAQSLHHLLLILLSQLQWYWDHSNIVECSLLAHLQQLPYVSLRIKFLHKIHSP